MIFNSIQNGLRRLHVYASVIICAKAPLPLSSVFGKRMKDRQVSVRRSRNTNPVSNSNTIDLRRHLTRFKFGNVAIG